MIRLLVGLGNPGPEYEATRHNAGFWWIDAVAQRLRATLAPERGYFGLVARVNRPGGEPPLWLLEPMTFMNASGKSVAALARFFKIAPDEILVAHDELDLLPGQLKLKLGGSHAGHNGLKDIQAALGNAGFWRLRLGIGHPGVKAEVIDYVLRKPAPDQREAILKSIDLSLTALDLLLAGDMERAMMKIHVKAPRPPKPVAAGAAGAAGAGATVPGPKAASEAGGRAAGAGAASVAGVAAPGAAAVPTAPTSMQPQPASRQPQQQTRPGPPSSSPGAEA